MPKHPNDEDSFYPSKDLLDPDKRVEHEPLHEIDNYRMACKWYKKHLLDAICNDSPDLVENDNPSAWTVDDEVQRWCHEWAVKLRWRDAWETALQQAIKKNDVAAFYKDLESKNWTSTMLVDAFKKLEVIYRLEKVFESEGSDNEKIKQFQEIVKKNKATLVARRREGGPFDTFVRMLGVACAAILGLPGLGVGAYFAGKAAHARLFRETGTTGSKFVEEVNRTAHRKKPG